MRGYYFPVKIKNSCNSGLFIVKYKGRNRSSFREAESVLSLLFVLREEGECDVGNKCYC